MPKTIRVALTGGGTGGHTYPLLAVMAAIEREFSASRNIAFHYFGARDEFSEEIIERASFHGIAGAKMRRYSSLANIFDIPKFFWGLAQALWKLYWVMPDVLFSKGGTGALPVVLAAFWYRIPIVIHESDSMPGLNNLLSARFARKVAVSFEAAAPYFSAKKVAVTGAPARQALLAGKMDAGLAKEKLGFNAGKPLVFAAGGSQGSQRVNEFILANLKEILPLAQVFHQTGAKNFLDVKKLSEAALLDIPIETAKQSRYECVAYLDAQGSASAFSAADVFVGRAGSGTVFEIAAFGKPAIFIPLPESARDHQRSNAYAFAEAGGAKVIEESNLTTAIFISALRGILENKDVRAKMAAASAAFHKPDADRLIGEEVMRLAGVDFK